MRSGSFIITLNVVVSGLIDKTDLLSAENWNSSIEDHVELYDGIFNELSITNSQTIINHFFSLQQSISSFEKSFGQKEKNDPLKSSERKLSSITIMPIFTQLS